MFSRCFQDVCRIFPGWSFQMKVGTLMIQRNLMIPGIWWFQVFDDLKEISIGRMDFHNPKVYGDTSISDGLAFLCQFQCFWQIFVLPHLVQPIIIARTHEHHKYVTSLLPEWKGVRLGVYLPNGIFVSFNYLLSVQISQWFSSSLVGLIQSVAQVTVEAETLIVRDVPVFAGVW